MKQNWDLYLNIDLSTKVKRKALRRKTHEIMGVILTHVKHGYDPHTHESIGLILTHMGALV